jgi:hypothetical protein
MCRLREFCTGTSTPDCTFLDLLEKRTPIAFWNLNHLHFYHTLIFTFICFLCFSFFSFISIFFVFLFLLLSYKLLFFSLSLSLCTSSFIVCTHFFASFTLCFFLFSYACVCGFPFHFLPLYTFSVKIMKSPMFRIITSGSTTLQ